jgi:hypothetical protein
MAGVQRYVTNELAHFVGRGKTPDDQFRLLITILQSGWLTHAPHALGISGNLTVNGSARLSSNEMYNPQIICFCDIPFGDLSLHTAKYSRFGLSLSKQFVVANGGCPVFYLPRGTRLRQFSSNRLNSEEVSLGDLFDQMVPEFHQMMHRRFTMEAGTGPGVPEESKKHSQLDTFLNSRVFSYLKFFDESLADEDVENYYMEREWRVVGNLSFSLGDVQTVIIPRDYAGLLRAQVPEFLGQVICL